VAKRLTRSLAIGLATFITGGCSQAVEPKQSSAKSLTISDVTYIIPENLVNGLVTAEEGEPFVRISPPHRRFMLVYSTRSSENSPQGPDVPTVPFINDFPAAQVEVLSGHEGKVVCAVDTYRFNCGLRIYDGQIPWNVLFNRELISQVSPIRAEALELISTFRR
jgi:hypothetical protein